MITGDDCRDDCLLLGNTAIACRCAHDSRITYIISIHYIYDGARGARNARLCQAGNISRDFDDDILMDILLPEGFSLITGHMLFTCIDYKPLQASHFTTYRSLPLHQNAAYSRRSLLYKNLLLLFGRLTILYSGVALTSARF